MTQSKYQFRLNLHRCISHHRTWKALSMTSDEDSTFNLFKTNLSPEEIFRKLDLPVIYVDGVVVENKGRARKFIYQGRELYSPEIVSVVFFESNGHLANWSEGLAFGILKEAVKDYLSEPLFDHFSYVGPKQERIEEAHAKLENVTRFTVENYISRHGEQSDLSFDEIYLKASAVRPPSITTSNYLDNLNRKDAHELAQFQTRKSFFLSLEQIFNGKLDVLESRVSSLASTVLKTSVASLRDSFNSQLEKLRGNKDVLKHRIELPEKTEDKTNPQNKFINDWTLKFATTILEECDIDYLVRTLLRYEYVHPRWDLTVIDKDSKELRFIEVKLKDKFTPEQLRRLASEVSMQSPVELCVVRPS